MEALRRINKDLDITVISNLHHLATARSYCERIVGMRAGRIVFNGTPAELSTAKALEIYGSDGDSEELLQALDEGPVGADEATTARVAIVPG
jgi:phosphonate transport system ATP-binding protein